MGIIKQINNALNIITSRITSFFPKLLIKASKKKVKIHTDEDSYQVNVVLL